MYRLYPLAVSGPDRMHHANYYTKGQQRQGASQGGYFNGSGRSFDQMHFSDLQGKFTTVQVDIQQLYVHCTKKVPEYRYPLYFEKFKNRADFAMLIHAD